jgi:hypothetical protein
VSLIPTTGRCVWIRRTFADWPAARQAMNGCFYTDGEEISEGVRSGRMQLLAVNHDSWAVIEIMRGMLFVWCFAGKDSKAFIAAMQSAARDSHLSQVSFFSRHRGAARLWKYCNPRMIPTAIPGEVQYVFEVPV